jgi:hypothetical protein
MNKELSKDFEKIEIKKIDHEKQMNVFIPEIFSDSRFFKANGDVQENYKPEAYKLAEKHEEDARNWPLKREFQNALTTISFLLSVEKDTDAIGKLLKRKIALMELCKEKLNEQDKQDLVKDMCGTLEYVHHHPDEKRDINDIIVDMMKPQQNPETQMSEISERLKVLELLEDEDEKRVEELEVLLIARRKELIEKQQEKIQKKQQLAVVKGYASILKQEKSKTKPWEDELSKAIFNMWATGYKQSQEWNKLKKKSEEN